MYPRSTSAKTTPHASKPVSQNAFPSNRKCMNLPWSRVAGRLPCAVGGNIRMRLAGRTSILGLCRRLTQRPEAYTCFPTKLCKVLQLHWENFPLFIDPMRLLPVTVLASGLLAIICEFASCCSGPTPTLVSSQIVGSVPHCVTLLGDCLHPRTRIGHIMARPPVVPNPIPHRPSRIAMANDGCLEGDWSPAANRTRSGD